LATFTKFPSIESFSHVYRRQFKSFAPQRVVYGAKIKLHGTNAGIRVSKRGEVAAQSRNRDLTIDADNFDFAAWLEPLKPLFATCTQSEDIVFFGEWAGPGVQPTDAVSKTDRRRLFIFAIQIGEDMHYDPGFIYHLTPSHPDIEILPTEFEILVDYAGGTGDLVDRVNAAVDAIAEEDPYIARMFDVSDAGEGLVLAPMSPMTIYEWPALTFKAKAEAHRVKKEGKAVSERLSIPAGAREFVATFVTEARCQQGLNEVCGGVADPQKIPAFLAWVGGDVKEESGAELEDMGLEWKAVAKLVNQASVRWFKARGDAR
jgi:hypothetical protein